MRLTVGGTTYEGRVVDLRGRAVDGATLAAAVRGDRCLPAVASADPPPVYDYCGHVHAAMGLRTRTALAAAGRSRGYETPHDDAIDELREQLASSDPDAPSLPSVRDDVSRSTLADQREAAATQRGRLEARRTLGVDTDAAEQAVREATRTLSERETERVAAEESRRRRRELARAYRDRLAERRQLADALANRQRDARECLVDRLHDRYVAALEAVPGSRPTDPFEASPVTAALAVLRIARTEAPVVVGTDCFADPTAAADVLDAPIIRC
ncbi:hypothetical protein NDI85_14590 [Halomicroarcula sp. S1AR25-4]|uniref:DUF7856 family protein n=1 Tax=Haloarcula sp. S1AR25-4 TaxID=2950538 RepID=UPI00287621B9|nr:hypothetical protein [Halomicroarcula sp. S1AR25-4]MDS0279025.1 hypothetical protein [Halomicroarcula sp. S1AR25-4]